MPRNIPFEFIEVKLLKLLRLNWWVLTGNSCLKIKQQLWKYKGCIKSAQIFVIKFDINN